MELQLDSKPLLLKVKIEPNVMSKELVEHDALMDLVASSNPLVLRKQTLRLLLRKKLPRRIHLLLWMKMINDREVGGKCYGFVTFTNPRSAIDAISDMNGRTIGGRVVRVNDVRPRGARPNFQRENFHRDAGRDVDWDKERDREREYVRDRERYKDRNIERSRDRDRERERDHSHDRDFDRTRNQVVDRSRDQDDKDHARDRDRNWERDHESDFDQDRDVDAVHDASRDKGYQSKNKLRSHSVDRRSRELSSDFSEKHSDQVKEQLDIAIHRRDELQGELDHLEDKIEEEEEHVSDLLKRLQKLEEAVAAAKKFSSQRQLMLAKLHKSFVQVQEYTEKLKTSEQELQVLVDNTMSEVHVGEDAGPRDGLTYTNGQI